MDPPVYAIPLSNQQLSRTTAQNNNLCLLCVALGDVRALT